MAEGREISSLAQLREEKRLARRQVEYGARKLRNDVNDVLNFRGPFSSSSVTASPNKYLSYLGYAFTAFKIASTVMNVVKMFKKKKR